MPAPVLVLLHSPLVGPLTWQAVAARLTAAGRHAVPASPVRPPDLAGVPGSSLVLVGHSGAGPLLPGLAASLGDRVAGLIYVDAQLPYPGKSWWESAPRPLVEHLEGLLRDGMLPPWHEWFAPDAVASLLPNPVQRSAFVSELRPVPVSLLTTPTSTATWSGPAGYLLLSEGYREDAEQARAAGAAVTQLVTHHLAMLTDPDAVAEALLKLDGRLRP